MKKIILSLTVTVLLSLSSTLTAKAQALSFYIENLTGFTLNEINVAPSESLNWGDDILPNDLFYDETKVEVYIPSTYGETCFFDLRITDLEGNAVIYYGLDACKLNTISIYWNGKADLFY